MVQISSLRLVASLPAHDSLGDGPAAPYGRPPLRASLIGWQFKPQSTFQLHSSHFTLSHWSASMPCATAASMPRRPIPRRSSVLAVPSANPEWFASPSRCRSLARLRRSLRSRRSACGHPAQRGRRHRAVATVGFAAGNSAWRASCPVCDGILPPDPI